MEGGRGKVFAVEGGDSLRGREADHFHIVSALSSAKSVAVSAIQAAEDARFTVDETARSAIPKMPSPG